MAASAAPLTNLQLEILDMFQHEVPEEVILEVRRILVRHLAQQVTAEVDEVFSENDWGEEKIEELKEGHYRTPYKKL